MILAYALGTMWFVALVTECCQSRKLRKQLAREVQLRKGQEELISTLNAELWRLQDENRRNN